MNALTDEEIIKILPTEIPNEIYFKAAEIVPHEPLIIYQRESISVPENPMDYIYYGGQQSERHWGARCSCTECGDDFTAGWLGGSILIAFGDDGQTYSGWIGEDWDIDKIQLAEGDSVTCPNCGTMARMAKKSNIKNGQTYQRLITSSDILQGHFVLITWLATRRLDEFGWSSVTVRPRESVVLMPNGSMRMFTQTKKGMYITCERCMGIWSRQKKTRDPMQSLYYSYDAFNMKIFGGELIKTDTDFAGTTAEKTGLADYLIHGGTWPYVYLRLWRKNKTLENLMKSRFSGYVVEAIRTAMEQGITYQRLPCSATDCMRAVDFKKTKPHEMLGMSKREFKEASAYDWTDEKLMLWQSYSSQVELISPADFYIDCLALGTQNIKEITDDYMHNYDHIRLSDIRKYIKKQEIDSDHACRLFIDYRKMLINNNNERALTYEELFPRDLVAAHDRFAGQIKHNSDSKNAENFKRLKFAYADLEWTDGHFCVVIPSSNEDLIKEGKTLRHCVGGYGERHLTGRPIFFVRHYRRPERSYYTLNEDLTGEIPRRIQLHGYGNESHGEYKQYRHKIPQDVLDFCERWENEILKPWAAEKNKNKKKGKKGAA